MAEPEGDGNNGRVERLEKHDDVIEVFIDFKNNRRNIRTATQEITKLTGLSPDIARLLAKEMKKSVMKEGAMVFRNGTKYSDNVLRGRIAAGLKVPYNIATSIGERDGKGKDRTKEERD